MPSTDPYPANIFLPCKCYLLFMPAAYIQMHLRLISIMESNTLNPDQTAPFESSLIWAHIVALNLTIFHTFMKTVIYSLICLCSLNCKQYGPRSAHLPNVCGINMSSKSILIRSYLLFAQ